MEINDILTSSHDEFSHDWFGRGRENLRQFMEAYNNVSALIRERISKLALTRSALDRTFVLDSLSSTGVSMLHYV
jgi:hypothetical protein